MVKEKEVTTNQLNVRKNGVSAYMSADQVLAADTTEVVDFDSTFFEHSDVAELFNTGKLRANERGLFHLNIAVSFAELSYDEQVEIYVGLNGTRIIEVGDSKDVQNERTIMVSHYLKLNEGDKLTIRAKQPGGDGTRILKYGKYTAEKRWNWLQLIKVG